MRNAKREKRPRPRRFKRTLTHERHTLKQHGIQSVVETTEAEKNGSPLSILTVVAGLRLEGISHSHWP